MRESRSQSNRRASCDPPNSRPPPVAGVKVDDWNQGRPLVTRVPQHLTQERNGAFDNIGHRLCSFLPPCNRPWSTTIIPFVAQDQLPRQRGQAVALAPPRQAKGQHVLGAGDEVPFQQRREQADSMTIIWKTCWQTRHAVISSTPSSGVRLL